MKLTSSWSAGPVGRHVRRPITIFPCGWEIHASTIRNLPPYGRPPSAPVVLGPTAHVWGVGIEGLVKSSQQHSVSAGRHETRHRTATAGRFGSGLSGRQASRPTDGKSQLVPSSLAGGSTYDARIHVRVLYTSTTAVVTKKNTN